MRTRQRTCEKEPASLGVVVASVVDVDGPKLAPQPQPPITTTHLCTWNTHQRAVNEIYFFVLACCLKGPRRINRSQALHPRMCAPHRHFDAHRTAKREEQSSEMNEMRHATTQTPVFISSLLQPRITFFQAQYHHVQSKYADKRGACSEGRQQQAGGKLWSDKFGRDEEGMWRL